MPTWMRVALMLMAVRSDNVESTLQQIGYMALSWCLKGLFRALQGPIMVPKLVRMGKMHPEVARRGNKRAFRAVASWFALTIAVVAFLFHVGVVRITLFLCFTALILPVFRAACFPSVFPVFPFLVSACYAVWRWEGVQELFLGLVLFQALPKTQELLVHYAGCRRGQFFGALTWIFVASAVMPVVATFLVAYLVPELLEALVSNRADPAIAPYWALLEWYYGVLGFAMADGENPYRVLGVPQTASEAQIRKRFRQLSVKYHPDKTGNDVKKKEYFMKLQGAMEVITKGTFDGPANDNALRERLRGTVARCSELTPIIGIWVALTLLAFLAWLVQAPDKDVKSDDSGGGESVVGDGGELQGGGHAMDIPREFDIGPNFLGGGVLGYGSGSARRGRRAEGRVDVTTVGGRRVTTPNGPMPTVSQGATQIVDEPVAPTAEAAAAVRRRSVKAKR